MNYYRQINENSRMEDEKVGEERNVKFIFRIDRKF